MTRIIRMIHTRPPRGLAATALAMLMAVAACSGAGSSAAPGDGSGPGRPSVSPPVLLSPEPSGAVTGEVPTAVVEKARSMLAAEVGAEAAAGASVVVAEAVTWPDGSLGCPEPGIMYTQQLVPGYQVVFEVDGGRYDFRASEGGELRLCAPGGPRAS